MGRIVAGGLHSLRHGVTEFLHSEGPSGNSAASGPDEAVALDSLTSTKFMQRLMSGRALQLIAEAIYRKRSPDTCQDKWEWLAGRSHSEGLASLVSPKGEQPRSSRLRLNHAALRR
ncbi:ATP-dependent RNA helicase RhlB [Trichinella spiralis]|uniref:ATP-dependent RNA helicase RhlB n=1 Tax=Trichinella spiralis TaxID=6334 RepID=A0ABR3KBX7_TRISP